MEEASVMRAVATRLAEDLDLVIRGQAHIHVYLKSVAEKSQNVDREIVGRGSAPFPIVLCLDRDVTLESSGGSRACAWPD